MQVQQQYQQPQVMIASQQPQPPVDNSFKNGSKSQMHGLSVTQIVMGCLCMIMGIALIPLGNTQSGQGSVISVCGYGIWLGLFFVLIGIIGVRASKSKRSGVITAALVLNIIFSAIGCVTFVSMTSVALNITSINRCYEKSYQSREFVDGSSQWVYDGVRWNYEWVAEHYRTVTKYRKVCDEGGITDIFYAFDSIMLIFAIIELIVNIWSAVLCCGAVCRCCKTPTIGTTVQYSAGAGGTHQLMAQPPNMVAMYPNVTATTYHYGAPAYAPYQLLGYQQPGIPVGVHPPAYPPAGWIPGNQQLGYGNPAPPPVPPFNAGRSAPLPPVGAVSSFPPQHPQPPQQQAQPEQPGEPQQFQHPPAEEKYAPPPEYSSYM